MKVLRNTVFALGVVICVGWILVAVVAPLLLVLLTLVYLTVLGSDKALAEHKCKERK